MERTFKSSGLALRSAILLIILVMVSACSGGGNSNPTSNNSGATSPTAAPQLPVNGQGVALVARVNGEEITLPEFERALARSQDQSNVADPNTLAIVVLNTLIEQTLIHQAAAQIGVTVSDEEVLREVDANRSLTASAEEWQNWLAQNMYTEAEFQETMRSALITMRLRDAVTRIDGGDVLQVHARHILLSTEAEANAIIQRLQNGEDFGLLASQYSNDVTTRDQGGDLGWFIREDLLTPELADVALQMQPGQIAGPITTLLGYHIIQMLETGQRQAMPEEQARLVESQFANWLSTQADAATIERFLFAN